MLENNENVIIFYKILQKVTIKVKSSAIGNVEILKAELHKSPLQKHI